MKTKIVAMSIILTICASWVNAEHTTTIVEGNLRVLDDPNTLDDINPEGGLYVFNSARLGPTSIYGTVKIYRGAPGIGMPDPAIDLYGDGGFLRISTETVSLIPQNRVALIFGNQNSVTNGGFVLGDSNFVGNFAFTVGESNYASYFSLSIGESNYASNYGVAFGYGNTASGYSFSYGLDNISNGLYTFTGGLSLRSSNFAEFVIGIWNDPNIPSDGEDIFISNDFIGGDIHYKTGDPVFVIGNGTSSLTRSNAVVIRRNGNAEFAGVVKTKRGGDIMMGAYGRAEDQ